MNLHKTTFIIASLLALGACNRENGSDTPPNDPQDNETRTDNVFNIAGNNLLPVEVEQDSLVRNPCMGWGLYDDAPDYVADASIFWMQMDKYAKYATHLYVRWRWVDFEPEEGQYAWLDKQSNFSRLIQGALDRGLKLAFRVYYDSDGQHYQATPDYVRQAGAEGRWNVGWAGRNMWSPYADDPVFQQKLGVFVEAFAKEFDDPDRVDFIDAFNLGFWGEGHDISFKAGNDNETLKTAVVKWITNLYGNAFRKVPLVINYHKEIGESNLDWVLENQDYQLRHDAFGSKYYAKFEKDYEAKYRTKRLIVAESCYWFVGTDKGAASSGGVDFTEQWRSDNTYSPRATSWADVYRRTYNEAAIARANTLDMREEREAHSWTTVSPDIVQQFISYGGYRFTPVAISFPPTITSGKAFDIGHKWRNSAFGLCPNNNKRWNNKYKAAFAFINESDEIRQIVVDWQSNPADWLNEADTPYVLNIPGIDLPPGKYRLAVAIVDTSKENNPPGINLACKNLATHNGWKIVAIINIVE
ncbi:MAG: DUF4832 domain-containing protein [Dysgonamonadaceae bacterium]|jgi:hypothetical protein|nr:DUF4832 domain-containing protein [Dysgonamonadaceae bacterium]